jgi:hypothetical protein
MLLKKNKTTMKKKRKPKNSRGKDEETENKR